MTLDWDGKIRMDCSSRFAMASLIERKDSFDVAFANDTDADRHGIVTRTGGLMNPNHYLAVAIDYLFQNRPRWPATAAIGKTAVSSSLIDRVSRRLGRRLMKCPWGSSGLSRVWLAGRSVSEAKRARERRFCARTDAFGPPIKMGSFWACFQPK